MKQTVINYKKLFAAVMLTQIHKFKIERSKIENRFYFVMEAFFAEKKCITVLEFVCWPETMVGNRNVLAKPLAEDISDKIKLNQDVDLTYKPFGDGQAAVKIVEAIENFYKK